MRPTQVSSAGVYMLAALQRARAGKSQRDRRPPSRVALTFLRATQVIFINLVAPGGQPELAFRLMFDVDALLLLTPQ